MDWCLDPSIGPARRAVGSDVAAHLSRRIADPADVAAAAQRLESALGGLDPTARFWLSLGWEADRARVEVFRLRGSGGLPGVALAEGATVFPGRRSELAALAAGGPAEVVDLELERPAEKSLDADPGPLRLPAERDQFLAGIAALGTGLIGYTGEECCALAGAAAARQAEDTHRADPRRWTAADAAEAFVAYQRSIGGDFEVDEASESHAVVTNRTCPFGAAVIGAHHLCRTTSAMLGSMAAGCTGEAAVTLDERIALGDRRCRLTLRTGPGPHPRSAHRYTSPPVGLPSPPYEPGRDRAGHGISLSLQLPRDRMSVPVIRHLGRYSLTEVGVTAEVIGDIEVALSEACANVLEHAGAGDAYEVTMVIQADRCELRVVDTGHGFDHQTVREHRADLGAERGRGLALMQSLMDRVHFVSEPHQGTLVTLTKQLVFDEDSPARVLLAAERRRQAELEA